MIEVRNVEQTARDLRPLKGGWGVLHWYAYLPWLIPYLGLVVMTALLMGSAPWLEFTPVWIALVTVVLWVVASHLMHRAMLHQAAKAPSRGVPYDWAFDNEGLVQTNPLMSSHIRWAAMHDVREEADRFIILISPQSNPVLPKRLMTEAQIVALRTLVTEVRASGRLGRGVD
ncbi:MAG: YcxB family protein [Brevundimonas sp.]|nr:YcxB family protein [Brevundimonas sp.]